MKKYSCLVGIKKDSRRFIVDNQGNKDKPWRILEGKNDTDRDIVYMRESSKKACFDAIDEWKNS